MSELERLAREAAAENIGLADLVQGFLDNPVIMPSATNPNDEVTPVMTDLGDVPHIVVAASEAGLERTNHFAKFAFSVQGKHVVAGLTPGVGILVNTADGSFAIPVDTLDIIRARTAEAEESTDPAE